MIGLPVLSVQFNVVYSAFTGLRPRLWFTWFHDLLCKPIKYQAGAGDKKVRQIFEILRGFWALELWENQFSSLQGFVTGSEAVIFAVAGVCMLLNSSFHTTNSNTQWSCLNLYRSSAYPTLHPQSGLQNWHCSIRKILKSNQKWRRLLPHNRPPWTT